MIHVDGSQLVNFASNDYLGLSFHEAVCMGARGALENGVGSGASRLVSGDDPMLHRLETKLAEWKGFEACLIVGSGMLANIGLLQALGDRFTHAFADKLNHASLVDGVRLSGAKSHRFNHLQYDQLVQQLQKHQAEKRIIISDGIFSMDGDSANAGKLLDLAQVYDALLVIDDAHGTGVTGPDGRGITARDNIAGDSRLIEIGTFGKAFGSYGAFVLGTHELVDGLKQRLRTVTYSTALPVAMIAAAETALALIKRGDERKTLDANLSLFRACTASLGFIASESPIQPLIVGSDQRALELAANLRENGFFVPAIRPPTVPENSSRLRFTITAAHSAEQIEALCSTLTRLLA